MLNLIPPSLGIGWLLPGEPCYLWNPEQIGLHLFLNMFLNSLIALACYAIALTLLYFVHRRRDLPLMWTVRLLSLLILSCGTTNLIELWAFWHPVQGLLSSIKLLTAAVAISTAVVLGASVSKARTDSLQFETANWALQQEIIACKQIEEELIRSRELREAIFNESADALFLVDSQTLLTLDCNHRAVALFEAADKTELIGIAGHTLQHRQFTPTELDQIVAEIQSQGMWSQEIEYITRRGNLFWGNIAIKPITVGQRMMNLVRVTDISERKRVEHERKQAEAAIQQSEARYRAIVEDQTELIARFHPDGTLIFLNQAYCRYFGVNQADLIGHHYEPVVFADDRERVAALVASISQDNPTVVIENRVIVGGEVRWTQWVNRAFFDQQGHLLEVQAVGRDINDLKQAEENLRQSEERLQLALEASGDGLWDWHIQTGEVYYNPRYFEMLGFAADELPHNISTWEWLVHPDDMVRVKEILAAHLKESSVSYRFDYRLRTKSGEWKWIADYGKVVARDPQGQPLRMLGTHRDVNFRKQAEETLRRYERIVAASTDAILLLDRNCIYQVVNQAYLNWYNKQLDEVVGHPVSDIMPTTTFENTIKPLLERCLNGQEIQYEMWVDYPTLGSQFLSITYSPYFDTNQTISGVVVSLRNITRLKRAEMELELQSIILRNMAEGVCMIKASDSLIVYANPKFEQMFGYSVGELKGTHISKMNYGDETLSAEEISQIITREVTQRGEATYEVQGIKKDGTPFWCRATTSIFQHPEHETVMVAVQQDITEQKRAEEQIKASLKEKEVLLKEIHHRVKNNLGIVDSLLQMQARRLSDPEIVETLKESQNRIASIALVHEKLYRSEDLANIDFAQYISDLAAHLFESYNVHSSHINLRTQVHDIPLDIDTAIPCGLIINELVSNALKYAFPDERVGEIYVEFCQTGTGTITLTVQDNGIGLPKGFNLNQTKTLGMKLIQGLVKQLQGTLEISSQPRSTFKVTINR